MDMSNAPRTYRLGSSKFIHAPGLILWAIIAYKNIEDRESIIEILLAGYAGLPKAAATALLSEAVPYKIAADTVIFTA